MSDNNKPKTKVFTLLIDEVRALISMRTLNGYPAGYDMRTTEGRLAHSVWRRMQRWMEKDAHEQKEG